MENGPRVLFMRANSTSVKKPTCGGVPKIQSTFLGVPILKTIVFGVHIGVPLIWETTM